MGKKGQGFVLPSLGCQQSSCLHLNSPLSAPFRVCGEKWTHLASNPSDLIWTSALGEVSHLEGAYLPSLGIMVTTSDLEIYPANMPCESRQTWSVLLRSVPPKVKLLYIPISLFSTDGIRNSQGPEERTREMLFQGWIGMISILQFQLR